MYKMEDRPGSLSDQRKTERRNKLGSQGNYVWGIEFEFKRID